MTLARSLDLLITAKGIERADEVAALLDLGCEIGQGYYFSRPLSVAEVDEFLRRADRSDDADPTVPMDMLRLPRSA
jgi:EAL domain-containing protein (putative c-di-GMP-specific phosphodiesterase class I)